MFKTIVAVLLLGSAMPAFSPAEAALAAPAVRVGYADLNLASAEGVAELDRRIARAVERVCPDLGRADVLNRVATRACRAKAAEAAARQRDAALAFAAGVGELQLATASR